MPISDAIPLVGIVTRMERESEARMLRAFSAVHLKKEEQVKYLNALSRDLESPETESEKKSRDAAERAAAEFNLRIMGLM